MTEENNRCVGIFIFNGFRERSFIFNKCIPAAAFSEITEVIVCSDGFAVADMVINKNGKVVKTAENYKNNQRIKINRMPKGMYTVSVKTVRGEKKIKFNLK